MKALLPYLFLLLLSLPSCGDPEPLEMTFHVRLEGYEMEQAGDYPDPGFRHRLSGGVIKFTRQHEVFGFDAGDGIGDYAFTLPEGEYLMEGAIPEASLYGQDKASFRVVPTNVSIGPQTDTVLATVVSDCSLVLVWDAGEHLEESPYMIERHSYADGYFISYPMSLDSLTGAWYAYLSPDREIEDPSAFIWFYGDSPGAESGGLSTTAMEKGKVYQIQILE